DYHCMLYMGSEISLF
nr:immunoglobulin light chain junction region [Macaca mulatta]